MDRRLRREAAMSRFLRSKRRSLVARKVGFSQVEHSERVSEGRIVRTKVRVRRVPPRRAVLVTVHAMNKSQRRSFFHFASQHNIRLTACEWSLVPLGNGTADINRDSLATAYIAWGPVRSIIKLSLRDVVRDVTRVGAASHRLKKDEFEKKAVHRPKAKDKRSAHTRMVVVRTEMRDVEEQLPFGRTRTVNKPVSVWEERKTK